MYSSMLHSTFFLVTLEFGECCNLARLVGYIIIICLVFCSRCFCVIFVKYVTANNFKKRKKSVLILQGLTVLFICL